jgi:hypothetical protein
MIEQRLPAWSQRTARRELVIDESVHTTRSAIACASNGATPSAGTVTATAKLPSVRRWPSVDVVGRLEHHHAVDPHVGRVGERPALRCDLGEHSGDASFEIFGDAGEDGFGVGMDPRDRRSGRMSWNCWVSTSRQRSSTSADRPRVAAHSSASTSRRSHRRLPSFVRSWLVRVPRWVSK